MPEPTIRQEQVSEALERRGACADFLDDARKLLVQAAKQADCTELRAAHMDICGSISRCDWARVELVGNEGDEDRQRSDRGLADRSLGR